jgi:hypothetical protein
VPEAGEHTEPQLLLEPSRDPLKIASDPWFEAGESK